MNLADAIQIFATLFAAVAAVASWRSIFAARRLKIDDELLAHATVTLERAYEALIGTHDEGVIPDSNRLNWLTAARLIEDYVATKKEMKTPEIIRRCNGHEEFWRNKFYQRLEPVSMSMGYYRRTQTDFVYPISAVIVHGFATWPKEKIDPLDKYRDVDAAIEVYGLSRKWISLRQYLERL